MTPDDLDLSEFMPRPACKVEAALAELIDSDKRLFEAALAHPQVTTAKIVERFAARSITVGKDAIRKHRHGDCSCD